MITIIIPTKNRVEFLGRLLRYYAENNYPYYLSIGDASDDKHAQEIKSIVDQFKEKLRIAYYACQGLSIPATVSRLSQFIETPYVTLVGDDDFLIPSGLKKCADFLGTHNDYIAAHGVGILLILEPDGPYGAVKDLGCYRMGQVQEVDGSRRLLKFLRDYFVSIFSVHRTEVWKIMWQDVAPVKSAAIGAEIIPCCLGAIEGKIKQLDCFYLVRQHHVQRYYSPDCYDRITDPDWFSCYRVFRDSLSKSLMRREKITLEKAQGVIKQAFWQYLNHQLLRNYKQRYADTVK